MGVLAARPGSERIRTLFALSSALLLGVTAVASGLVALVAAGTTAVVIVYGLLGCGYVAVGDGVANSRPERAPRAGPHKRRGRLRRGVIHDTIWLVASLDELLAEMRRKPKGVRFADACKVATRFFGSLARTARSTGFGGCPGPAPRA